jgi:hypothetical protein
MQSVFSFLSSKESEEVQFLRSKIEGCKQESANKNYTLLQRGFTCFTSENLKKMDEQQIAVWAALFQVYVDKLQNNAMSTVKASFEGAFPGKKIEPLLLKELLQVSKEQKELRLELSLLQSACRIFTKDTIRSLDRKIALAWHKLFEEHDKQLDKKELGAAFSAFHRVFTLKPEEVSKRITFLCRDNQQVQLPLALLLSYPLFERVLTSNTLVINVEKTDQASLQLFQKCYFSKNLRQDLLRLAPAQLLQLVDIVRWVEDDDLLDACKAMLQQLSADQLEGYGYVKEATTAAINADRLYRKGEIEQAKTLFKQATELRSTDATSLVTLGKIALHESDYRKALEYFKLASKHASFKIELYILQAQTLLQQIRYFDASIRSFIVQAVQIGKKMRAEAAGSETTDFLQSLLDHVIGDSDLAREEGFSDQIAAASKQAKRGTLTKEEFFALKKRIVDVQKKVKMQLLHSAENAFAKIPSWLGKDKEHNFLQGEIAYEKGELVESQRIFEAIRTIFTNGNLALTEQEQIRLYYDLVKVYIARNMAVEARIALSDAICLDTTNTEILRTLITFAPSQALLYGKDFLKAHPTDTECHYAYGAALYGDGDVKNAKAHFMRSDLYDARVNFFLAIIDNNFDHYVRALRGAHEDGLEGQKCLKLAEVILMQGGQAEYKMLLDLLLQLPVHERGDLQNLSRLLQTLAAKLEEPSLKRQAIEEAYAIDPDGVGSLSVKMRQLSLDAEPDLQEVLEKFKMLQVSEENVRNENVTLQRRVSSTDILLVQAKTKAEEARRKEQVRIKELEAELNAEKSKSETLAAKQNSELAELKQKLGEAESKDEAIVALQNRLAESERLKSSDVETLKRELEEARGRNLEVTKIKGDKEKKEQELQEAKRTHGVLLARLNVMNSAAEQVKNENSTLRERVNSSNSLLEQSKAKAAAAAMRLEEQQRKEREAEARIRELESSLTAEKSKSEAIVDLQKRLAESELLKSSDVEALKKELEEARGRNLEVTGIKLDKEKKEQELQEAKRAQEELVAKIAAMKSENTTLHRRVSSTGMLLEQSKANAAEAARKLEQQQRKEREAEARIRELESSLTIEKSKSETLTAKQNRELVELKQKLSEAESKDKAIVDLQKRLAESELLKSSDVEALKKELEEARGRNLEVSGIKLDKEKKEQELQEAKRAQEALIAELNALKQEKQESDKRVLQLQTAPVVKKEIPKEFLEQHQAMATVIKKIKAEREQGKAKMNAALEPEKMGSLKLAAQSGVLVVLKGHLESQGNDKEMLAKIALREEVVKKDMENIKRLTQLLKNSQNVLFPFAERRLALEEVAKELATNALHATAPLDHAVLLRKTTRRREQLEYAEKTVEQAGKLVQKAKMNQEASAASSKAKAILKCALLQYENEVDIRVMLGKIYFDEGKLDKALALFTKASELRAVDSAIFVWLGKVQLKREEYGEAERRFLRAQQLDSNCIDAYSGYVRVAIKREDGKAIRERIKKVRQDKPALFDSFIYQNPELVGYLDLRDASDIRKLFEKKIKDGSATFLTYCSLAKICYDTKDFAQAKVYAHQVLEWKEMGDILQFLEQVIELSLDGLKQKDRDIANKTMQKLVWLCDIIENKAVAASGIVKICDELARVTHAMSEEQRKIELLIELIKDVHKLLESASSVPFEYISKIRSVGIGLVWQVVDKDLKRAKEVFTFFTYLAEQEEGFSSLQGQDGFIDLLINYLRSVATKDKAMTQPYQKIIQALESNKE